ncbi:hypothetical protein HHI36_017281 [Cryptolaemus montrouzieri]|uniref:Uncharacterized protein n=1 Tax=Cryptolaemus montrouzieri TaxID=559131 RepID=A0ABD2NMF4_9CUCU
MNLMFRKNFREQKSGGISSKVGKASVGRHTSKRASREQGYSPIDEHHYRTHLFFSPPRVNYTVDEEDEPSSGNYEVGVIHTQFH